MRTCSQRAAAIASACIAVPIVSNLGLIGAQHFTDQTKALKSSRNTTYMPSPIGRGCERTTPLGPHYNPRCTWHAEYALGTIVLLGDSNAAMYTLPVIKAGKSLDYDVTVDGASSCPYVGLRLAHRWRGTQVSRLRHQVDRLHGQVEAEPGRAGGAQ